MVVSQGTPTKAEVSYRVFEIYNKELSVRILSPDLEILRIGFPNKVYGIKETKVKTSNTVDYLLVTLSDGNKIKFEDIKDKNEDIKEILDSYPIIKKENNLKHLKKQYNYANFPSIEEFKGTRPILEPPQRIPFDLKCADNSSSEDNILEKHLNFYLKNIGLQTINKIDNFNYFYLSSVGDSLLSTDLLLNYDLKYNLYNKVVSNKNQQFALVYLGNMEFLTIPEHLAGTFFEAIYFCSKVQNNKEVTDLLIQTLLKPLDGIREKDFHNNILNSIAFDNNSSRTS